MTQSPHDLSRIRSIRAVLWWVLAGNLAVALAKILYGLYSGSVSIKADGLHSLADSSSNIIGLLALSRSGADADAEHPYGHRKLEIAGALGISFLICIGLWEIGRAVVLSPWSGHLVVVGPAGFAVVLLTLAVNTAVAWQENRWGRRLNSPILLADARHTFSDSLATLGVLASFILAKWGFQKADVVIALLIMLLVGRAAWIIFRQALDTLMDRSQMDPVEIEQVVASVEGVMDCHRVRSRGMAGAVFLDFHILVDSHITMEQAHKITHEVETTIRARFPDVVDVVIHTEPASDGREPYPWEAKTTPPHLQK